MDWDKASVELAKPLNPAAIKPPPAGKHGEYVDGLHVIREANRIFGFGGWSYEVTRLHETSRGDFELKGRDGPYTQSRVSFLCTVKVTVDGVTREGCAVGTGNGKPENIADVIESAVKEAETDALKRALRSFGNTFGLALYEKDKDRREVGVPRDPDEMTARIINAIDKAALLPNLQKITFSEAFKETFAWLEAEHPGHAESIRDAQERALARIDPARQAPDERAA